MAKAGSVEGLAAKCPRLDLGGGVGGAEGAWPAAHSNHLGRERSCKQNRCKNPVGWRRVQHACRTRGQRPGG